MTPTASQSRAESAEARAEQPTVPEGCSRSTFCANLFPSLSRLVQVVVDAVAGISSSVSELVTVMSDTHTHTDKAEQEWERDAEEKREKSSKAVTDCQLLTAAAEGERKKKKQQQAKRPLSSIS